MMVVFTIILLTVFNSNLNAQNNGACDFNINHFSELRNVFNNNHNQTIVVCINEDIVLEHSLSISGGQDITLRANTKRTLTTQQANVHFDVNRNGVLRLENLNLTSGNTRQRGGIIVNGSLFLDDVEMYNLRYYRGAAIHANSSAIVTINNSRFYKNEVTSRDNSVAYGGAIYLNNSTTLVVNNSEFRNNRANAKGLHGRGEGGAIFARRNATVTINNSKFVNNYADTYGGAIFVQGNDENRFENLTIDNKTDFNANKSVKGAMQPPVDASTRFPSIQFNRASIADHVINNYDIGFNGTPFTGNTPEPTKHRVIFLDSRGEVIGSIQYVIEGQDAIAPVPPSREGFNFTGWDTDFTNVTSPLTIRPIFEIKRHTVRFVVNGDEDNAIIREVDHGTDLRGVLPIIPEGHTFSGWNNLDALKRVKDDLTVHGSITINTYRVEFLNHDGKVLRVERIEHGSSATPPINPIKIGHTFTGWDRDFSNVTSDLTINARFTINEYTVTFVDFDGTVLSTQRVEHGSSAVEPERPNNRVGWTFHRWSVSFDYVTGDLSVKAIYTINRYTVRFLDHNGVVLSKQRVVHGGHAWLPRTPHRRGFTFRRWDTTFRNITSDRDIRAIYTINHYRIMYDLNGGINHPDNPSSFNVESKHIVLRNPSREGYTFTGWSPWGVIKRGSVRDRVFVASWERTLVDYSVRFVVEGQGDIIETVTNVKQGDGFVVNPPVVADRVGYSFDGWYDNPEFTGERVDFSQRLYGNDNVFYARFVVNKHRVTFVDFNGTILLEKEVAHGQRAIPPSKPNNRVGWTFDRWSHSLDNVTRELRITAFYRINTYTVRFLNYDGSVLNTQSVNHNSHAVLPSTPTRRGHTFDGWNQSTRNIRSNTDIRATFRVNNYQIIYRLNGGINHVNNPTTYTVHSSRVVLQAPTRVGHSFRGWTPNGVIESGSVGNRSFTANWDINVYNVEFVLENGTLIESVAVNHGDSAIAPTPPEIEGFVFDKWDVDFSNVTSHLTITALYRIRTYTVSFIVEGQEIEPMVVEHGRYVELPIPERSGYNFIGWYLNGYPFDGTMPIVDDIELEARWSVIEDEIDNNISDEDLDRDLDASESEDDSDSADTVEGYESEQVVINEDSSSESEVENEETSVEVVDVLEEDETVYKETDGDAVGGSTNVESIVQTGSHYKLLVVLNLFVVCGLLVLKRRIVKV